MRNLGSMLITVTLALYVAVPNVTSAQDSRGPSTAEERARAISTLDDIEQNPLGPKAKEEREWLLFFLIKVPDIHVGMCAGLLPELPNSVPEKTFLNVQPTLSSARYAIRHNGGNANSLEQYQAGLEGTLTTYESVLKVKPEDRQPGWDELLKRRADGSLQKYVKEQVKKSCKK